MMNQLPIMKKIIYIIQIYIHLYVILIMMDYQILLDNNLEDLMDSLDSYGLIQEMDLKVFYGKNINIFKYSELDEITNPNSSAIVDINGDCKSDLVFYSL